MYIKCVYILLSKIGFATHGFLLLEYNLESGMVMNKPDFVVACMHYYCGLKWQVQYELAFHIIA